MADKFTIHLEYDRDEILAFAEKCRTMSNNIPVVRGLIDMMYPAWDMDTRTSIMVELMYRKEGDMLYDIFVEHLAELDRPAICA